MVAAMIATTTIRKDAAKMFVKAEAGFFGYPGRVGVEGPKKIPDILLGLVTLHRHTTQSDLARLDRSWRNLLRLNLLLHFRLHPCSSPENAT
jgi:hypothetical protein